jgi:hypothetical protein
MRPSGLTVIKAGPFFFPRFPMNPIRCTVIGPNVIVRSSVPMSRFGFFGFMIQNVTFSAGATVTRDAISSGVVNA